MNKYINTIAIITARGGSKRIPRKNIIDFYGKPMIAWSIEVAFKSQLFKKIIVSTDDEEIAEISQKYGAEIPFIRPTELANDYTPTAPVVEHAIKYMQNQGEVYEYACCIYPTAPFIQADDLRQAYKKIVTHKAPVVLTVTTYPFPILRSLKMNADKTVEMFYPKYFQSRSQDLPEFYHDAGQFYFLEVDRFLKEPNLLPKGTLPLVIPRMRVQDLDTYEDLEAAKLVFTRLKHFQNK